MENNKKVFTVDGKCPEGCHECCSCFLPLNDYEINKIKKTIRRNGIKAINRSNIITGEFVDICPFVNDEGKCNIYVNRPEVCKRFKCDEDGTKAFNHADKRIVNMFTEFFPDSILPKDTPDAELIDGLYQEKKNKVYKNI